ncbi:MAG: two-component sensor histidine kinase [Hyphococcus sp.]|nr:MAG: two-component sensor histidine kinase [Marinicaulis sp.]
MSATVMLENLPRLIKTTVDRQRLHDFLWALGVSAGIGCVVVLSGAVGWGIAVVAWLSFGAALGVRYYFSANDDASAPVAQSLEEEMNSRREELSRLQVAQGVAQALPEPLFILDAECIVEYANQAAEDFVGTDNIAGRHFAAVLRAPDVIEAAENAANKPSEQIVEFTTTDSVERSCRALVAPLNSMLDGSTIPFRSAVFIRDLTGERRVEQMRADFIASASHELRTPLASLLGFIETLRGHAKSDPEAQEKFLKIMQAQAERMQRLVSDLMSLSRIELNEHVPPREKIDLSNVVRDVIDSMAPLFETSGAIADFIDDAGEPPLMLGERDEIFQAVQNLLDNAVKYGGEHAMIKLRVGRGAAPALSEGGSPGHRAGDSPAQIAARVGVPVSDLLFIQIRDFGPGIERAAIPRLTERFYRVNIDQSRKSGGTGLGLAIVKHIVNRHRGGFQIESQLAGGTAFNCYFPAAD